MPGLTSQLSLPRYMRHLTQWDWHVLGTLPTRVVRYSNHHRA